MMSVFGFSLTILVMGDRILFDVDYRQDAVERLNHPGLRLNTIWDGSLPKLKVSGPGLELQSIPNNWYFKN